MFKWTHDYALEVNLPIQKIWQFNMDLNQWPQWMSDFESFDYEAPLKTGSIAKAKLKNKNTFLSFIFKEVKPYTKYCFVCRVPLFKQESICTLQPITRNKTLVNFKTIVTSPLVPFMKSYFLNKVKQQYVILRLAIAELA